MTRTIISPILIAVAGLSTAFAQSPPGGAPDARAPMLVALSSFAAFVDPLSGNMWAGVVLICAGIIAPAFLRARRVAMPGRGTVIALANAVIIAAYTIVDGQGTRLSGNAISYGQWLFLINALPLGVFAFVWRRHELLMHARARWRRPSIAQKACRCRPRCSCSPH